MRPCPGESQTLTGADGARVEISACLDPQRPPRDVGPERIMYLSVRLKNTGVVPAPAMPAPGAGLLDVAGHVHSADLSRSLPSEPHPADDPQLEPGEQADWTLVVPVGRESPPLQFSVVLPMRGTPVARWFFPLD
ncbi:hypothetical protein [Actinoplanes philippinensis]|uniref:hypothetical protein n=1 Tax=Actinoplanes philippinensis TaxID=35752 RepID=UPI00340E911E